MPRVPVLFSQLAGDTQCYDLLMKPDVLVLFVQASDGGVFNVELGSSATIEVFPTFEHNSVLAGYSGGAIYAGGKVN